MLKPIPKQEISVLFRLFVIIVLLAVSLYAIKLWRNRDQSSSLRSLGREPKKQTIVECMACGVHVPENKAIRIGDKTFCSPEHIKTPPS